MDFRGLAPFWETPSRIEVAADLLKPTPPTPFVAASAASKRDEPKPKRNKRKRIR